MQKLDRAITVTTERLRLFPASDEEMKRKIAAETDGEMKKAYAEMLAGCIKAPKLRVWYAMWFIQLQADESLVGDLCFKGLNADGSVEIGYGIRPEYEGRGLMTEAVAAMAKWAAAQAGVLSVQAETEPQNAASQRVLQKSGFVPNGKMGEEGPRFTWIKG